jgi:hypothetical protein
MCIRSTYISRWGDRGRWLRKNRWLGIILHTGVHWLSTFTGYISHHHTLCVCVLPLYESIFVCGGGDAFIILFSACAREVEHWLWQRLHLLALWGWSCSLLAIKFIFVLCTHSAPVSHNIWWVGDVFLEGKSRAITLTFHSVFNSVEFYTWDNDGF